MGGLTLSLDGTSLQTGILDRREGQRQAEHPSVCLSLVPTANTLAAIPSPTRTDCSLEPGSSPPQVAFLSTHFAPARRQINTGAVAQVLSMQLTDVKRHEQAELPYPRFIKWDECPQQRREAMHLHPVSIAWRHCWVVSPRLLPFPTKAQACDCTTESLSEYHGHARLIERVCLLHTLSSFLCPPQKAFIQNERTIP